MLVWEVLGIFHTYVVGLYNSSVIDLLDLYFEKKFICNPHFSSEDPIVK